jgi:hypothetical protein
MFFTLKKSFVIAKAALINLFHSNDESPPLLEICVYAMRLYPDGSAGLVDADCDDNSRIPDYWDVEIRDNQEIFEQIEDCEIYFEFENLTEKKAHLISDLFSKLTSAEINYI